MADLVIGDRDDVLTSVSDTPPTHYMVRLQSFSLLTKNDIEKYCTSEFEAGGYRWKLIIYPDGNKTKNITDNISIYLMLAESSLLHPGLEVHAIFKLFLRDQNKDNYMTLEVGKGRRFHKMKQECGFGRFLALRTFNDPLNGYLVNDTCVFGAEVYVCKENNRGKGESLLMMKDAISHKHTWKIQALSTIKEDFQESLPFNAGDHKWKIRFYPRGKGSGTGNHISLYLALADPANLPNDCQIYADFTLRIIDQIHSKNYFGKANYWFSGSNPLCGWPRFISLGYFNLPSSGLLVKDSCSIEAEVTVHGLATSL